MASLKDMRNRIASVKATRKITKAMQMVAAAKLRRAQEAATAARPYAAAHGRGLASINATMADKAGASPLLVGTGKDEVHLLVVMTAERGLCGGFNTNIARLARQDAAAPGQGRQDGQDHLRRPQGRRRPAPRLGPPDRRPRRPQGASSSSASPTPRTSPDKILALFEAGEFDVATLYFSEFKSVIAQKPTALQLIPASCRATPRPAQAKPQAVHEFEPSEEEILAPLIARNIATQVFRGLLENAASEQGARMRAMDSATRNAGDMINKLTIKYNRQRQANITKELIEIISGAEAL